MIVEERTKSVGVGGPCTAAGLDFDRQEPSTRLDHEVHLGAAVRPPVVDLRTGDDRLPPCQDLCQDQVLQERAGNLRWGRRARCRQTGKMRGQPRVGPVELRRLHKSFGAADGESGQPHDLARCNEAESMVLCAEMFYRAAMERKESRGWFVREDYPKTDNDNWLKWIIIENKDGDMQVSTERIPIERYPIKP